MILLTEDAPKIINTATPIKKTITLQLDKVSWPLKWWKLLSSEIAKS
jgi:hypothetical protein